MNTRVVNFSVGLFVIFGVVALVWLALTASSTDSRFGKQITISAEFENIGSLKVKAPIMIAGVRVGRVSNIALDPEDFEAQVEMKIDEKYKIPTGSKALIYTAGLVGEQYISIEVDWNATTYLEDGGKITRTDSALVIERLIGQFLTSMGNKD